MQFFHFCVQWLKKSQVSWNFVAKISQRAETAPTASPALALQPCSCPSARKRYRSRQLHHSDLPGCPSAPAAFHELCKRDRATVKQYLRPDQTEAGSDHPAAPSSTSSPPFTSGVKRWCLLTLRAPGTLHTLCSCGNVSLPGSEGITGTVRVVHMEHRKMSTESVWWEDKGAEEQAASCSFTCACDAAAQTSSLVLCLWFLHDFCVREPESQRPVPVI